MFRQDNKPSIGGFSSLFQTFWAYSHLDFIEMMHIFSEKQSKYLNLKMAEILFHGQVYSLNTIYFKVDPN